MHESDEEIEYFTRIADSILGLQFKLREIYLSAVSSFHPPLEKKISGTPETTQLLEEAVKSFPSKPLELSERRLLP